MTATPRHDPDNPDTRLPPAQQMPPAPDLQFVIPPTDPLGLPAQPVPSSQPVHGEQKRPTVAARIAALVVVLLVIGAVVLLIWAGS